MKLNDFTLRVEEIETKITCAAVLYDDYWRSPRFTTLCGRAAKWPGYGEVPHTNAVTCLNCWSRVLPESL